MEQAMVDKLLSEYRQTKGRAEYMAAEIKALKHDLEAARMSARADLMLSSPCNFVETKNGELVFLPRSGLTSNPTADVAIRLADGSYKSQDTERIEQEINEKQAELDNLQTCCLYVQAWLNGLTDRERWVIEQQVIEGCFWRDIVTKSKSMYGDEFSKDTLKRIRDMALIKIYRMAR